ncbi:MAG: histidine kinase [Eubacteriales bacterium]|nr:histidine kinase [Eubacteriales bacterium]
MKRILKRLQQHYGDMKLQSKITFSLMLMVTIPMLLLALFFYGRLYEMVVSYTIRQEQDASAKTSPLIEKTIQQVQDGFRDLAQQPSYQSLFSYGSQGSLRDLAASPQAAQLTQKAKELVRDTRITHVRIYTALPKDSPFFTQENTASLFCPMERARGTYWYGIFQGSPVSHLFCPPFYLGTTEKKECGDLAYIHRTELSCEGQSVPAYVALYYSSSQLVQVLKDNLALEGSVSYILNERNNLVASSNGSLSGMYWLNYDTIEDSFMSSNSFIERNVAGRKIYAGFYRINQAGWFMVTVLPSEPLIAQSNRLMVQYILLYLFFLLLAFALSNLLAHSITSRISSVISQMRTVRQGPPTPMDSPLYHDEVGDLIDTYNYMTRKMNHLIQDQAQTAEDLRIAEFNSLQAQINPHFLYNTMDMINWMAQQGQTSQISSAVQSLSRFYKLTLSRKKGISTIAQEEEHVSIYIHLQNMRYHDRITFISDVPDELMEYQIPKLTLQPVVENAILHGILEKDTKAGTIVLTGWMEESHILLLVSDDGVGIPEEKLPHILSGDGQSASGGTNIAIYNTHRRLQLLYGDNCGLTYSSEPGRGTEVQIRIPARKREEPAS